MIVNRSKLFAELTALQSVVPANPQHAALRNIGITASEGRLHLAATDLSVSMRTSVEVEGSEHLAVSVHAGRLVSTVRADKCDDLELLRESGRKGESLVVDGSARVSLACSPYDELPEILGIPDGEGVRFQIPAGLLHSMIGRVSYAAGTKSYTVQGVQLTVNEWVVRAAATDGNMIAVVEAEGVTATEAASVIIPSSSLSAVGKLADGMINVALTPERMVLTADHRSVYVRPIQSSFPDVTKLNWVTDATARFGRREMLAAIRRVMNVWSGTTTTVEKVRLPVVQLRFGAGEVSVSAASEVGYALEAVKCDLAPADEWPAEHVYIADNYLIGALSSFDQDTVRLSLKRGDPSMPLRFEEDGEGPYRLAAAWIMTRRPDAR